MFQILIVDDDKNVRRYLGAVLAEAGYSPHTASSQRKPWKSGDDLLRSHDSDIMMPGMDGYEFTKLLPGTATATCRFSCFRRNSFPTIIKHGFLAGTDDYMTKPVDEEELILRIRALRGGHASPRSAALS